MAPLPVASLEAKLCDLLEAAPDAMVVVDREGRILMANSEAERVFFAVLPRVAKLERIEAAGRKEP